MLNIVIPMAGRGSRFVQAGYQLPKPLIPIHGVPMIELVAGNLRPSRPHRFIFLCLQADLEAYNVADLLHRAAPGCEIVVVDQVTEGAACTVLLARKLIDSRHPLMIANSDQWVDLSMDDYLALLDRQRLDGLIMTMRSDDPKWSFVRLDAQNRITEVVEKQVVSAEATVGIYNFARGSDFVAAADEMIGRNLRVNNEFYVAPAYNRLIECSRRISFFNIGSEGQGMHGLGIPADLELFLESRVSRRAVASIRRHASDAAPARAA